MNYKKNIPVRNTSNIGNRYKNVMEEYVILDLFYDKLASILVDDINNDENRTFLKDKDKYNKLYDYLKKRYWE